MKKLIVVIAIAAVLAGVTPAFARPGIGGRGKAGIRRMNRSTTPGQVFQRMDANGDGRISAAEFSRGKTGEKAQKVFGRMDANHDGGITPDEFQSARMHMHGQKGGGVALEPATTPVK